MDQWHKMYWIIFWNVVYYSYLPATQYLCGSRSSEWNKIQPQCNNCCLLPVPLPDGTRGWGSWRNWIQEQNEWAMNANGIRWNGLNGCQHWNKSAWFFYVIISNSNLETFVRKVDFCLCDWRWRDNGNFVWMKRTVCRAGSGKTVEDLKKVNKKGWFDHRDAKKPYSNQTKENLLHNWFLFLSTWSKKVQYLDVRANFSNQHPYSTVFFSLSIQIITVFSF